MQEERRGGYTFTPVTQQQLLPLLIILLSTWAVSLLLAKIYGANCNTLPAFISVGLISFMIFVGIKHLNNNICWLINNIDNGHCTHKTPFWHLPLWNGTDHCTGHLVGISSKCALLLITTPEVVHLLHGLLNETCFISGKKWTEIWWGKHTLKEFIFDCYFDQFWGKQTSRRWIVFMIKHNGRFIIASMLVGAP